MRVAQGERSEWRAHRASPGPRERTVRAPAPGRLNADEARAAWPPQWASGTAYAAPASVSGSGLLGCPYQSYQVAEGVNHIVWLAMLELF